LINFASADIKTKSFNGSDEESYALQILPEVIEGIYKRNNVLRSLLINDICGKCHQHVCWDFYETPVFAPNIARFISHGEQASFSLNGNTYHLATGETLSSDKELINNQYSWYYNDHGDRFHIAGLYYRKQFSGITTEGKQLIDFVLREIQIYYRTTHKMRTLKAKACPYVEYADEVNTTIQQCLEAHESYEIVQHEEEDVQRVKEFVILKEEELKVPSKFKFMRERQSDQRVVLTGHNDDNSIEFLEIPDDIEEIGAMAFAGCTNLKAVVGGFGLKQIGVGAFLDCSNLQTVVLQDGTKQIDDGAFSGCIQLEEILIPMSVHRIGNYGGPCVFEGNPTILCGKYSAAYNYAVEHNLKYKITETNW
jgi:hypothetical protein